MKFGCFLVLPFLLALEVNRSIQIEISLNGCIQEPCIQFNDVSLIDTINSLNETVNWLKRQMLALQSLTCKELYDKGVQEDGLYILNGGVKYECDMTNGGWTKLLSFAPKSAEDCQNSLWAKDTYGIAGCSQKAAQCQTISSASVPFPLNQIRGRARAHQYSSLDSFSDGGTSLEGAMPYVDGISITYGNVGERSHLWTFAGGFDPVSAMYPASLCPCNPLSTDASPPFVGEHYFCSTGFIDACVSQVAPNPLWDQSSCDGGDAACCSGATFPYFERAVSIPAGVPLESRLCLTSPPNDEDIIVTLVELWGM
eukprot:GCRY01001763.1.p1 GENE.GCRY01001763.1~~GCRY01001763.1.p1  ORF type:complete len:312 (+),score=13.66 GCRY01001763.1:113-1048(+)